MTASLRIEIRDKRLAGGRISLSARTTSRVMCRKREGLLRTLMDRGDFDVIARLRARDIHWTDIERAARTDDYDSLRRPAVGLTLGALMDRVVEIVEATKAEGTAKQYRVLRRQLIAEFGRDFDPAALDREGARRFLHRPRKRKGSEIAKPWSPRKQEQVVALAGRSWREAIVHEAEVAKKTGTRPRIDANPWREVDTPEVRPTRQAFLRPEEWRRLSEKVAGTPVAAALGLACLAGLRAAEIRNLRTGVDIDLQARRIHVQSRDGEHPWRPKTRRGTRDLRVSDELLAILEGHAARGYAGERYFLRTPGQDRPMHSGTLERWVAEAFGLVGIQYGREGDALTLHSLRHTFASWLAQRDVQVQKIAELLGERPETTYQTYAHLLPRDLDAAVDLVGKIGGGA